MNYETVIKRSKKMVERNNQEVRVIYMLLEHVLNLPTSHILANLEEEIDENKLEEFSELLAEYVVDEKPVAYILGYTYFYNLKLTVNNDVFIPRKETEELVGIVIDLLKDKEDMIVADIATGSGNIAISVKKNLKVDKMYAVDISDKALDVASKNASDNDADIHFINGDLLQPLIDNDLKVDVIISNPPYIKEGYPLSNAVYNHEPHLALFAKKDGMENYERILVQSKQVLNDGGYIFFEIGFDQGQRMIDLIKRYYPNDKYEIRKDLSGNDRFVIIEKISN
ncbi:TPA: peptide chain release factor N(5)-glutamine methyltransferase [bacterium]|nr:peptide chain release factor N(5)-glutamine methyltransferase [bacterium]